MNVTKNVLRITKGIGRIMVKEASKPGELPPFGFIFLKSASKVMHVHKFLDPGKKFFLEFLPTYCVYLTKTMVRHVPTPYS